MPRKPDMPCAECGKPMWRSRTSLPVGEATCRECRREGAEPGGRHGYAATYRRGCRCDSCRGANSERQRRYQLRYKAQHGEWYSKQYHPKPNLTPCSRCGRSMRDRGGPAVCSKCRAPMGPRQKAARAKLRKAARGTRSKNPWCQGICLRCGEYFLRHGQPSRYCSGRCRRLDASSWISRADRLAIYERDGWTCQLCTELVDPNVDVLDDWAPTLDHIIPRSHGGSDEHENLRLAHRWCNSVRGDDSYYTIADLVA